MATGAPYNSGLDWGTFSAASELPNVSGAATQSPNVTPGARAYVPGVGAYTCTVATEGAATWELTGAIVGGGTGAQIGPFTGSAVGVAPAVFVLGLATVGGFVAPRAGLIKAMSGRLSAAATGDILTLYVLVNGSPVSSTVFTDGGSLSAYNTYSPGVVIAAGDLISMATIGGDSLSNTPDAVAYVEFTATA